MSTQALQKLYSNSKKYKNEFAVHYKRWYTYHDLTDLIDRAAHFLIENGYKKNTAVPLYFDPCLEALILVYACHKIGAYYVPFNSSQPVNMVLDILKDIPDSKVICLKQDANLFSSSLIFEIEQLSNRSAYSEFQSGDFSYLLYTSGTTGRPKGILTSTKNLDYITAAMDQCFPCKKEDTLIWTTSWTFDVSIVQIFGFVSLASKLIIPDTNSLRTLSLIPQYVKDFSITHLNFAPTLLSYLFKVWSEKDILILQKHIHFFLIAGEKLSKDLAILIKTKFPNTHILNLYGPTETTVYASQYEVTGKEIQEIPIGKALPGCEIVILSPLQQPVAVNEVGEIFISGQGVSTGYYNSPTLTKEAFINYNNKVFYKSGDFAKLNSNNEIEFLYRKDRQIKIHGMRLELADIEYKLAAFFEKPDQVKVLFYENNLHVFYIGSKSLHQQLAAHLKSFLPGYAQPLSFIDLNEFPMNSSGKLDEHVLLQLIKK